MTAENVFYIINVIVSLIVGAISGFVAVAMKIARYTEKIDQLEKCNFNQRLSTLEGQFAERKSFDAYLINRSPVVLTEKGNGLLEKSGGKKFIDFHKNDLMNFIKSKNPKSAYDVQELTKKAIWNQTETDAFIPLKNYLFKEGLSLKILIGVMSVYLRDLVLEKLNFNIE